MPTDETLRRIREEWEREVCQVVGPIYRETTADELAILQSRSYDAGYQAGIEAARAVVGKVIGNEIGWSRLMQINDELDALKAVDRG